MNIHFIGIGGISMSGLAHVCINLGYRVSGSDSSFGSATMRLQGEGAEIFIGHDEKHIIPDIDLVVYTAAVKEDNPELVRARQLGIKILDRAQFLGDIMKKYENSVAISGTHGKTTTTSMTTVIFQNALLDPTVLVGGLLNEISGNVRIGNSQHFITEACEYVDSFLKFYPKIAVILNIEEDHLDYFKDIDQIKASFKSFASQIKDNGFIIANGDDENIKNSLEDIKKNVILFGKNAGNNAVITDETFDTFGHASFNLVLDQKDLGRFTLKVPGKHNMYNACAAILSGYASGIDMDTVRSGIEFYTGVGRRFELKGEINGVRIYDDYAHHPTEVIATLSAAKMLQKNLLYTVFQPHTYTRTKELLDKFSESFTDSDVVIITDIYASREKDTGIIHSRDLVDAIIKRGKNAIYISSLAEVSEYLSSNVKPGDVVFTLGAGDVYTAGEALLKIGSEPPAQVKKSAAVAG